MNATSSILFSVPFFLLGMLVHLLLCRLTSANKFMLKGLSIGAAIILLQLFVQFRSNLWDVVAIYLLATAWLAYLMFFINLLNSATLKMLERLAEAPNGQIPEVEFHEHFNEKDALKIRMHSMVNNGFIEKDDKDITLTTKAKILIRIIHLLRRILSIDHVG